MLTRQFTLTGPHVARYFARSLVARRLNYRSVSQKYMFLLITLIQVMLICIKVKLFYSFHNDNSYTQIDPNIIKTLILSSFKMFLDRIIFVCECLVPCDLLRITEAFRYKTAWQQEYATRPVLIVNRMSLI